MFALLPLLGGSSCDAHYQPSILLARWLSPCPRRVLKPIKA